MRRTIAYPLVALGVVGATLAVGGPAQAHGYISDPPSRQALCKQGAVPNCGPIQYEPQSVEGAKGLRSCDGGLPQFAALSDNSKPWPAKSVGTSVTFTWSLTARHRTANWEYYIGDKQVATVDGQNAQPGETVSHTVDLSGFSGRQTVLAVWNIGDTPRAFYNCVDLDINGSGGPAPAPAPSSAPPPAKSEPPAQQEYNWEVPPPIAPEAMQHHHDAAEWAAGVDYKLGDQVSHNGVRYTCRQAHSSLSTWEPSINTLALWLPLTEG
ncbi:lytic polysaccharide monooxygenase [Actinoplanes sp. NPDC049548]|uniref:lytic polysaccharide monooxygenase n=1 Tax=Actinoplanes sp. NPDC049548 TaxID=3155152 RepID=UPI003446176E